MVSTSAFVTSIATSAIIFLVFYVLFTFLVKKVSNNIIFYPARLLRGEQLPDASQRGAFSWIKDLFAVTEDELATRAGLDSAVYVIFQKLSLYIVLLTSVYCVPVIIAFARTDNYYEVYNAEQTEEKEKLAYSDFDLLAMGNIKPKSDRLWSGVIGAYWLTFSTLLLLYRAYTGVVALRSRHLALLAEEGAAEQYSTLVRDIPANKEKSTAKAVQQFFITIYGTSFLGSTVVPADVTKTGSAYKELLNAKKTLSHAEGVFELSKKADGDGELAPRPKHKIGFLGLVGEQVDSIDWWSAKISELEAKLKECQEDGDKGSKAAIVHLRKAHLAAAASQSMHAESASEWLTDVAPEPRDVEWSNLQKGSLERTVRSLLIYIVVFLMVVFYMIPIAFISSVTTLENLQKTLPFVESIVKIASLKTFLEAFLPQLALIVFLAVLPVLLTLLSQQEGLPSKSHIIRAASGKYFYFIVFNVFLGVTLGSTLINSLQTVINSPTSIVNTLGSSLPAQANFFITYIALRFFISGGLELSGIVRLVVYSIKKKFLVKTEYEDTLAWTPGPFNYVSLIPADMLIVTLAVCYAVISPLILPFAAAYFVFHWAIMKNQALNVYVPEFESQGRMWPHIHNRIVAALLLGQLTLLGFFGIKKFVSTVVLVPLPLASLAYFFLVHARYYPSFDVPSLVVASKASDDVAPSLQKFKEAYAVDLLTEPSKVGEEFFGHGNEDEVPLNAKVEAQEIEEV